MAPWDPVLERIQRLEATVRELTGLVQELAREVTAWRERRAQDIDD